jgi:hypothetical protein
LSTEECDEEVRDAEVPKLIAPVPTVIETFLCPQKSALSSKVL